MNQIFTWIEALFPSFLMALTDQLGCVFFLSSSSLNRPAVSPFHPSVKQKPNQKAPAHRSFSLQNCRGSLFLIFSVFLAVPFQRGGYWDPGTYGTVAVKMVFFLAFIWLWTQDYILVCLYEMMVYFLISDCLRALSAFISQSLLHYDLFLEGSLVKLIGANMAEAAVLFLTVWIVRQFMEKSGRPVLCPGHIPVLAVSLLPYLFIRGITIWLPVANEELTAEIPIMMLITLLGGLLLLIGNVTAVSSERHTAELHQLEQMLFVQHAQYSQSKEVADRVNRQYHDLKNTLLYIQNCTDQEQIRQALGKMLAQIRPYETELNTGNQAVNVILNQKLALCQENHIRCVPYIDGSLLDFMDPLDICTILGNALDNAIEACLKIADEQKRQIRIRISLKNQMLSLHVENSCEALPKEQDGQLLTDKPDASAHGFGMRSIRHTAEKYGGQLSYRVTDGQFVLDLLLPVSDIKTAAG
ncbi:MAG: ATP-binding protein [Clostridiales bacterium]|nr:ATP-binding protein [Clostridiales bacterium]